MSETDREGVMETYKVPNQSDSESCFALALSLSIRCCRRARHHKAMTLSDPTRLITGWRRVKNEITRGVFQSSHVKASLTPIINTNEPGTIKVQAVAKNTIEFKTGTNQYKCIYSLVLNSLRFHSH